MCIAPCFAISLKSTKMKRFNVFNTFNRHSICRYLICIAPCFAISFKSTKMKRFYIFNTFNIHSIDIQYVDIKYVLHHVLQLALRVPK